MDTIGFFTSEEKKLFFSKLQAPVTKPLLFPREGRYPEDEGADEAGCRPRLLRQG